MPDQRWPRPTVVTAHRTFDLRIHDAWISLFVREMPRTPGYVRAEADQHDRTVSGMPDFSCLPVFRGFSEPNNRTRARTAHPTEPPAARRRPEPCPTKLWYAPQSYRPPLRPTGPPRYSAAARILRRGRCRGARDGKTAWRHVGPAHLPRRAALSLKCPGPDPPAILFLTCGRPPNSTERKPALDAAHGD